MAQPSARRAPYKDFLQPALQRRFAGTAAILLGLAYSESVILSNLESYFWLWFPLGPSGLRALAIFICVLPIIILRIAHAHMGIRTSRSPFDTLVRSLFEFSTFETILTYVGSSWLFSQIYLHSATENAGIHWINHIAGRTRLNEQALFYTVNLVFVGFVQGILHLTLDQNGLLLGSVKPRPEGESDSSNTQDQWHMKISERLPLLLVRSGMQAITVGIANYVLVYHFIRDSAWSWAMWFFRLRYSDLPKYNLPPGTAPWSVWMLWQSMWASFLLCLLWNFADIVFRAQLAREPLKNGQPLTSESKDPNGSLVNGLRSKKPRIASFAMWELAFIARDYTARRQTIFEDIDRPDGPIWSQISVLCLDTIRKLEQRVDDYGASPAPPSEAAALTAPAQPHERISQPLKSGDVLAPRRTAKSSLVKASVANLITSPGKTPVEALGPELKRGAQHLVDKVMTPQQLEAVQPGALGSLLQTASLRVLGWPLIGPFFRQNFGRLLSEAVLGSPYAEASLYANAAYALSQLAVCSLNEDIYGNVQRDVPAIIRTFTAVIKKIEKFRDSFPAHWTDVAQDRQCAEVTELLTALKDGLAAVIKGFGPYSSDLRLSRMDMRLAQEAVRHD
ncbi:nucleoporin protein Ndc1-Nup [Poronia punctata]|nr:nucleoporin protein Ndc1-Nup [Poronia punctata]